MIFLFLSNPVIYIIVFPHTTSILKSHMLHVAFSLIKPDKEQRLLAWLTELKSRAPEVRATFENEGVRHEQAFILQSARGPLLVYAIEVEDMDAAMTAHLASKMGIDLQHRAAMDECLLERLRIPPLYECSLSQ